MYNLPEPEILPLKVICVEGDKVAKSPPWETLPLSVICPPLKPVKYKMLDVEISGLMVRFGATLDIPVI